MQRKRKGNTNNIVNNKNMENTPRNDENTVNVSIEELWKGWVEDHDTAPPTALEIGILKEALRYNPQVDEFWVPLFEKRRRILINGGYVPKNMKYWFSGGFREMDDTVRKRKQNSRVYIQESDLNKDHGW